MNRQLPASTHPMLQNPLQIESCYLDNLSPGEETGPIRYSGNRATYQGGMGPKGRQGRGLLTYPDGSFYEGLFENNKKTLFGRQVSLTEGGGLILYEGEFSDNLFQGVGHYINLQSQISYEGRWLGGLQEGFGLETWEDGSVFEGEYAQGMKNGQGIFKWKDGSSYKGDFRDDEIEGFGVYEWADGRKYEGHWKQNQFHGQGLFEYPNRMVYKGEYCMDKKHGYGEMTKVNGETYKGQWENGEKHGKGHLISKDGTETHGVWENNRLVSVG